MVKRKTGWTAGLRKGFNDHFEWLALCGGLLLAASFDPYAATGFTWCLLEWVGTPWCPGEGLGHSIAFMVRGDIHNSLSSNVMGLPAIIIIVSRTFHIICSRMTGRNG